MFEDESEKIDFFILIEDISGKLQIKKNLQLLIGTYGIEILKSILVIATKKDITEEFQLRSEVLEKILSEEYQNI